MTILINLKEIIINIFLPSDVRQDRLFLGLIFLLIIVNTAHFLLVGLSLSQLPDILILHSNIYFGPDLSGEWYFILAAPFLGFIISLAHYFSGAILHISHESLSFILIGGALFINTFLLIGTWFILTLNI